MARNDFAAVCQGKQAHTSRENARRHANQLRATEGGRINVYPCPFSAPGAQHFHVGHQSRAQAKRKNPRTRAKYAAA